MKDTMSRSAVWKKGVKDGIPIALGYFAVSFAFGIMAKEAGMTAFQIGLMSATNLTSAGQFAAVGLIVGGASFTEMALTQLIINLRYCLMSCALSQKWDPKVPFFHRLTVAFGVTDEIFGVSVLREGYLKPFYNYGLMSAACPGWIAGSVMGALCGAILPDSLTSALGIAIYGMFIAIVIPPSKKNKAVAAVVLGAMVFSTVFQMMPGLKTISSGFQIIIITVLVAAAAAILRPIEVEDVEGGEQ